MTSRPAQEQPPAVAHVAVAAVALVAVAHHALAGLRLARGALARRRTRRSGRRPLVQLRAQHCGQSPCAGARVAGQPQAPSARQGQQQRHGAGLRALACGLRRWTALLCAVRGCGNAWLRGAGLASARVRGANRAPKSARAGRPRDRGMQRKYSGSPLCVVLRTGAAGGVRALRHALPRCVCGACRPSSSFSSWAASGLCRCSCPRCRWSGRGQTR